MSLLSLPHVFLSIYTLTHILSIFFTFGFLGSASFENQLILLLAVDQGIIPPQRGCSRAYLSFPRFLSSIVPHSTVPEILLSCSRNLFVTTMPPVKKNHPNVRRQQEL